MDCPIFASRQKTIRFAYDHDFPISEASRAKFVPLLWGTKAGIKIYVNPTLEMTIPFKILLCNAPSLYKFKPRMRKEIKHYLDVLPKP